MSINIVNTWYGTQIQRSTPQIYEAIHAEISQKEGSLTMACLKKVPYIAALCLIIASVAISSITVTHVTAGELFLNQTTPSTQTNLYIPGNDTYIDNSSDEINTEYVFSKYALDISVWNELNDKNCEKLSKIAQQKYGGSLIFIVGKDANNNYILGEYSGHFLNKIYDTDLQKYLYIDYQLQFFDYSPDWHVEVFKRSNDLKNAVAFDLETDRLPFGVIWHY